MRAVFPEGNSGRCEAYTTQDTFMAARTQSVRKTSTAKKPQIYTLEIHIIGGPVTDAFVDRNPVVARTLEIRGNQTLQHLHAAMFDAFDREDEHLYEFQFGKEPNDPKANRYVLAGPFDDSAEDDPYIVGTVQAATIASLGLKVDQSFAYWFDFGDDWWHQIRVTAIGEAVARRRYPRITKRQGRSPPQYPDVDVDDEDDDELEFEMDD